MNASQKIVSARTALVLDEPFFGVLALRLRVIEDPTCPTAWTDGRSMGYNPTFIESLTNDEVIGLIAHEVMHCAMGHPWRRDGRDGFRWNVAADYAINYVLAEAGFRLPKGGLRSPDYDGKSAEWVYARLPEPPDGKKGKKAGKGQGTPMPGEGAEDLRDAKPDTAEGNDSVADGNSEEDWKQAVQQAATAAKQRGKLPASLDRFAKQTAQPKVNWRSVLHRFVQQSAKADYSWRQPNTRYLARGLYLPSLHSDEVGPIAVAIDTSGSIDDVLLAQFAAELRSVVDDVRPSRVHVLYCDAKVHRVDTFEREDQVELKPVGGGGTSFVPVLDYVDAMDEPPVCLVYLTDLYGTHRPAAPIMPVLWATTVVQDAPYGEVVAIE